ncbi:MAG: hypothetical protein QOE87_3253 [Gaiellales bacterium]|jgi:quinol monooxygenase YgiN|nr:hypothetical protein [Gaiellales bacterium]
MVTKALLVTIEVKPGKEAEVQAFLEGARSIVEDEPETVAWFAIRLGPTMFGVFDAFPDDNGRQAHLSGGVGQALAANAGELFDEPQIIAIDVLAHKLPHSSDTREPARA